MQSYSDLRTKYTYRQILNKFDNIIGLNRLKLFHINDSMFNDHPFVPETPKVKDPEGCDMDMINLKILNELIRER